MYVGLVRNGAPTSFVLAANQLTIARRNINKSIGWSTNQIASFFRLMAREKANSKKK